MPKNDIYPLNKWKFDFSASLHYLYVGTDFIEFYQLFGVNVKVSVIGNLISWYLTGLTPVSTDESYTSKAKDLPNPGSYVIIRHGKRRWYPGL